MFPFLTSQLAVLPKKLLDTNRWKVERMDKQNHGIYTWWILFSYTKEGNSDRWYNISEFWKHYAKWYKSDVKGQI